ncbi:hypothetical protein HAX54_048654 [Datura stramonium]|uniref:Uncharacterized protein n=1 Tax=Datura stramonium TaxID=4076 RepID=A0ABS8WN93_DATST|nr:hypothetical protein [Datura stramonium]
MSRYGGKEFGEVPKKENDAVGIFRNGAKTTEQCRMEVEAADLEGSTGLSITASLPLGQTKDLWKWGCVPGTRPLPPWKMYFDGAAHQDGDYENGDRDLRRANALFSLLTKSTTNKWEEQEIPGISLSVLSRVCRRFWAHVAFPDPPLFGGACVERCATKSGLKLPIAISYRKLTHKGSGDPWLETQKLRAEHALNIGECFFTIIGKMLLSLL